MWPTSQPKFCPKKPVMRVSGHEDRGERGSAASMISLSRFEFV